MALHYACLVIGCSLLNFLNCTSTKIQLPTHHQTSSKKLKANRFLLMAARQKRRTVPDEATRIKMEDGISYVKNLRAKNKPFSSHSVRSTVMSWYKLTVLTLVYSTNLLGLEEMSFPVERNESLRCSKQSCLLHHHWKNLVVK